MENEFVATITISLKDYEQIKDVQNRLDNLEPIYICGWYRQKTPWLIFSEKGVVKELVDNNQGLQNEIDKHKIKIKELEQLLESHVNVKNKWWHL